MGHHCFVSSFLLLLCHLHNGASVVDASVFSRFGVKRSSSQVTTTTTTSTSPPSLAEEVRTRFQTELNKVPLVTRRRSILNSTIDIRVKWQDDKNMVTYCEVPHVPLLPSAFALYFQNLSNEMPEADVMVKSIEDLETHSSKQALKGILHAPFPCKNRLLLLWKYVVSKPDEKEHLLILTDRDNESLMKKHRTPKEEQSLVVAKALIAYWVKPVHNDQHQVVGSHLQYLFHGDIGGKIPKFIKSTVGPRGAYDTVHGLLKHLHKKGNAEQP